MKLATQLTVVHDDNVDWIRDRWEEPSACPADSQAPLFSFLSVPFDYAVSHRPGCRFGPQKILEELNNASMFCVDKRVSLEGARFFDFGSVEIVNCFSESYSRILRAVASLPRTSTPIILGGDHSISDPAVRGAIERQKSRRIGLIVFDAHFDSRVAIPGKEHSGHWFRTLSDAIDYSRTAQLGINSSLYSERYLKDAEHKGVLVLTPYDIRRIGWRDVIRRVLDHVISSEEVESVYISVDIDVADQTCAPGTSVPNPGGLLAYEMLDAIFEIASQVPRPILDVTEVNPLLDIDQHTARLAAQVVINFLAGVCASAR